MLHTIQYSWKNLIRNKEEFFWVLIFPILLGTMFKIAFSNITAADSYHAIPTAIVFVSSSEETQTQLKNVIQETNLMKPFFCDEETALKKLEQNKVDGIIYMEETLSLTISADSSQSTINQSILQCFVNQYNIHQSIIKDAYTNHPEKLPALIESLKKETGYRKEVSLNKRNIDPISTYFYNLLAMSCLFASIAGAYVSMYSQGNLSSLGARKNISPVHKMKTLFGEQLATVLFQFMCNLINFTFLVCVLKIELTAHLPLAILTILVSCMVSVSFGSFIGAVGKITENTKVAILVCVNMFFCFMSGLMISNMRTTVDAYCPLFNKLNPAAVIADCFYSLSVADNLTRYTQNILTLLLMAATFMIGGFLLTRRTKYASL